MELVAIFLFIMYAHLNVGNAKAAIAVILSGGSLATSFWFGLVLLGLLLPFALELYLIIPRLLKRQAFLMPKSLEIIVPVAVLVGGFMLRYIIVVAGQITFPIGI